MRAVLASTFGLDLPLPPATMLPLPPTKMSNSITKATLFRDQAEECRQLGRIARQDEIRAFYARLAEQYTALAEAEEKQAGKPPQPVIG